MSGISKASAMAAQADKFACRLVNYFQGRNVATLPMWQPLRAELGRRILLEFRKLAKEEEK